MLDKNSETGTEPMVRNYGDMDIVRTPKRMKSGLNIDSPFPSPALFDDIKLAPRIADDKLVSLSIVENPDCVVGADIANEPDKTEKVSVSLPLLQTDRPDKNNRVFDTQQLTEVLDENK